MTNPYTFTDNPMVSGVSVCNTDIVNDNIMALKWMHDHISFRSIGEIVTSTTPLVDSGLHLLDGAKIESGSYANFVSYIADLYNSGDYPDLFTTESDWQTTVTQYGVCGKFVYDAVNNAVRLPKYSNKIYTKDLNSTAPVVGNGMTLGLTNGTDNAGLVSYSTSAGGSVSCIADAYNVPASTTTTSANRRYGYLGITTNATESGLIADLANITTSLEGYYYIVVATSTKTQIQVDIDEIATDLNGKADTDLTNASPSSSFAATLNTAGIRTVVYQTTSNGCEIRVWSNGFKEIFCKQITNASAAAVDIAYPTNGTSYAFTEEPTLLVDQYAAATATTGQAYRTTGYARSATGFSVYFAAANASISYYACGY